MALPAATSRLLIVSNRLPVSLRTRGGRTGVVKSSGGLAAGLEALRHEFRTRWIGWPGIPSHESAADWPALAARFHDDGLVPVGLTAPEVAGYYDGFANGVIWPLFHHLLDRIPIDSGDWDTYRRVNEHFARATADAWTPGGRIWIHDYHLMLVPALLRQLVPQARIGFFLHIPFPSAEIFRALPWRAALLEGLLGADTIAFHTEGYVRHFLEAVGQIVALDPASDDLWWRGRPVHVSALPMGVDAARFASVSDSAPVIARAATIRGEAQGHQILLGVDRLDYTKGIPRRLLAFQRLLERDASLASRVRFIQIAVPSRIDVRAYKAFRRELDELIGRINGRFGTVDSVPIHYLYQSVSAEELAALYRAADVMVVTPLRDGMNLVAKEFVASRTDEAGVLILSEFAGAAAELTDALIVNPYDVDAMAEAMARGLAMDAAEQRSRMRRLRHRVAGASVHAWARTFLDRLGPAAAPVAPTPPPHAAADALSALAAGALVLVPPVTLLLDYDGTLMPLADTPERARPDTDLQNLLAALAAHPQIDLHLVTGRSIETVQHWFRHLRAGLWAEHGAAWRRHAGAPWERLDGQQDGAWMSVVGAYLTELTARMPGTLVETKSTGLAWHHRLVSPSLSPSQLDVIRGKLRALLGAAPIDLREGRMVLELRPRGTSKGHAVRHVAAAAAGTIVSIGDDHTDEDMFAALPANGIAIHVGDGDTIAPYRLAGPADVRLFLVTVLQTLGARLSGATRRLRAEPGPA